MSAHWVRFEPGEEGGEARGDEGGCAFVEGAVGGSGGMAAVEETLECLFCVDEVVVPES